MELTTKPKVIRDEALRIRNNENDLCIKCIHDHEGKSKKNKYCHSWSRNREARSMTSCDKQVVITTRCDNYKSCAPLIEGRPSAICMGECHKCIKSPKNHWLGFIPFLFKYPFYKIFK